MNRVNPFHAEIERLLPHLTRVEQARALGIKVRTLYHWLDKGPPPGMEKMARLALERLADKGTVHRDLEASGTPPANSA